MIRSALVACAATTVSGLNLFSQFMPRSLNGFPTQANSVQDVLTNLEFPKDSPFEPQDFSRQDESADTQFYDSPRFCFHVDDQAVAALTKYYSTAFREWEKPAILDICASHVSHFPADVAEYAGRRVALGMNEQELSQNKQVSEFVVKDLNEDPTLPFEDNSFDIVTNVVSIDYLTQPMPICKEVARVLKPGGAAMFALSNRWYYHVDLEHTRSTLSSTPSCRLTNPHSQAPSAGRRRWTVRSNPAGTASPPRPSTYG